MPCRTPLIFTSNHPIPFVDPAPLGQRLWHQPGVVDITSIRSYAWRLPSTSF